MGHMLNCDNISTFMITVILLLIKADYFGYVYMYFPEF